MPNSLMYASFTLPRSRISKRVIDICERTARRGIQTASGCGYLVCGVELHRHREHGGGLYHYHGAYPQQSVSVCLTSVVCEQGTYTSTDSSFTNQLDKAMTAFGPGRLGVRTAPAGLPSLSLSYRIRIGGSHACECQFQRSSAHGRSAVAIRFHPLCWGHRGTRPPPTRHPPPHRVTGGHLVLPHPTGMVERID